MDNRWMRKMLACLILVVLAGIAGGCKSAAGQAETGWDSLSGRESAVSQALTYEGSLELEYASQFAVDYYQDGYAVFSVSDGSRYLICPEGAEAPADLMEGIEVLKQPLANIYLAATAAMDVFCELEALDKVCFSSQKPDAWSIPEAKKAMEQGDILYAGKYSMPDYELLLAKGCSLAVENNMISHTPEVREKLESFGIPVWMDLSSYEEHPLGRVEWIKAYGLLLGKEKEAQEAFGRQAEILSRISRGEEVEKTVAFFYLTSNGMVNVRVASDYIPKMIELAGGRYVFGELGDEKGRRSSISIQMEEFYHAAKDADYLIYNSAVDGGVASIEELIQREALFQDFKAVQENRVWCASRDLYQRSMSVGGMLSDLHIMLSEDAGRQEEMQFLYRLQ
ncbi:ABC transporter substrate-binding protein [Lachnospiraceae bacterium 29-84]